MASLTPMYTDKVSISLPSSLLDFVEEYRVARGIKSRSQVFEVALKILRERELEVSYLEANAELDPAWNAVVTDGLRDEAW